MEYGTLLVFLLFGAVFMGAALIFSALLQPHHPSAVKNATYECGIDPMGNAVIKYNMRFYTYALVYVVFAVESVFLVPWAVVYKSIVGLLPLYEILIFIFILLLGLAYAWKKGALKWE